MPRTVPLALLTTLALLLPALAARPCTAFLLEQDGEIAVGKSYDWDHGEALLLVNKRGVAKRSVPLLTTSKPHEWISKYASLTVNQYGRELPVGGMNEAGLVVEALWLEAGRVAPPDGRPALNEVQWVQWLLDSFADVPEVLAGAPAVRLERVWGKAHYFVCDSKGRCAVFEPLAGTFAGRSGEELPVRVLTNHTYVQSLAFLKQHQGFGGSSPIPAGTGSLVRFARTAAAAARPGDRAPAQERAFRMLGDVSLGDYSKWNLVYLPRAGRLAWRTSANRQIRFVDLKRFETGCGAPVQMLDIQAGKGGDASGLFQDYTTAANLDLVRVTLKDLPLPPGTAELLAAFPESQPCRSRATPEE